MSRSALVSRSASSGPNGAGKSSTMRMIGCVSPVTEGELRIFGLDPATRRQADPGADRRRAAGRPARRAADGADNLMLYGRYFDLPRHAVPPPRAEELLEFVQLTDRAERQIETAVGRHEAARDDRSLADQRSRAAAARRADDRARIRRRGTCCGIGCTA